MKNKKIFFSGIGGIGVSALAQYLYQKNYKIYGSDLIMNENIDFLKKKCKLIFLKRQETKNINQNFDFLIYSPAILENNPERIEVKKRKIKEYSYPEYLGEISKEKYTIAIAGTNGKTTTTAMISELLIDQKKKPTVIFGGISQKFKSNFFYGESKYFVVEACEYKNSFLNIYPNILIITNITSDHLDFFGSFKKVIDSFVKLINNIKKDGFLICDINDINLKRVILQAKKNKIGVIDYKKYNIKKISIAGEYNKKNACSALAVINVLNFNLLEAKKYLSLNFLGTKRRFEKIGITKKGAIIYDDYAHTAEAVGFFIKALKEKYLEKKIVIIFQSHLYSRTADFLADFLESLKEPDILFLTKIYSPRNDEKKINSEKFFKLVKEKREKDTFFCKSHDDCVKKISNFNFDENFLIATIGAGDVYKIGIRLQEIKI